MDLSATSAISGRAPQAARPPKTGLVTAILSNAEIARLARDMPFRTEGKDNEASWLARLSHTSVTQITFSSEESSAQRN